ncbi:uncharacterized protein LOC109807841 isoform X2 [Cajanus cajan]|uniref:uncharacterized protein LOC109807841 isoform X2 n=1 Tax=Cajanus cajan TaxID=3821 RepID=UPI00098D951E|nr:uncharacterized protein LOC109807841 isoform X2 [Cajanus cajan]
MDYDDNDFQSQNLHLPGEGSTKFPPVLRPYALPKFDFDESLQGNLRFDSLVETEVFLGIESNEDNQWIDAYSRGSSGIEFNSTAAESCSISRHNNVWSEATSSESVEMLLKSVGQEEFIPRETVIQESDACDELACLAKQMEPDPKPDDRNDFKDNVTDLQPPDYIHENLAGLRDVEREQSLAGVSQEELSIDGSLSNLQPHDMLGNVGLPMTRGILFTDGKSNDTNQGKVETVADGSVEEKTQEDLTASGVKTSITATSVQNISSTCGILNVQNEKSSLQIQNEQDLDSSVINKDSYVDTQTLDVYAAAGEAHHSDKPLYSIPMEETLESGNVVEGLETSGSILEGSLSMVSDGISDFHNAERCNQDAHFRDLSWGNAKEGITVDNQSAPNTSDSPMVEIKDDSSSEGHIVGVSKSECSTCPNFQQNVGTVEKTYSETSVSKEKELLNIGNQMDTKVLLSKSEASVFAVGSNDTSTVSKGNNDSKAGDFSSSGAVASKKSCISGEATQVSENNEPDKHGDHQNCCQNVSATDHDNKVATSDSSLVHRDVDQSHLVDTGVSSSSFSAGCMETKLATSTVSFDIKPFNNSASQYLSENISLTSREMVDVPPPSKAVSTHEVTDHYEQRVVFVGSASIDENENSVSEIANEASCEAKIANEATCEAKIVIEASSEAKIANESSSEAKIANEASSEAKIANEASSEAKIANEANSEVKIRNEASSAAKIGNDASSEAIIGNEASSEAKIANVASTEAKIANEGCSEAKIANEATTTLPVRSSEQETAPCPVTGTEKQDFSDTSRQLLCDTVSSCVTTASEKMGKPQETLGDKVDQECTKEVGVAAVLCESIEKPGDEVAVSFTKDDKEAIQENNDKSSSKISGSKSSVPDSCSELHETGTNPTNPAENTCGASVIFGSNPETEKDVNQVKASAHLVSEYINKDALNTSTDHDPKGNDASKGERSLAPEVNPVMNLSKKDVSEKTTKRTNSSKKRQQAPVTAANKASTVVEESSLTSALGTPKTKVAGNIPLGSPQISDGVIAHSVSQGTPERKTRRAYNKSAGKESSRKGNKGKTPGRQSERGDRSTSVSLSPSPGFQVMQSNEVQQYGHVDSIGTKPFAILNTSTSSLPDLNSSASPAVLFQQPFMDIQQVQLRAQIFVYGALIQGTVPDEAYMISAFGGPDGGRSIWQNAWSSCMERQHGSRTTDVTVKQNALQGKGISSPLGLAGSKATPTVANPLVPLSSPLWSLPTPSCDPLQSSAFARGSVMDYSQALASLHPYQTTPLRNFLGHNTSWLSQTPLRGAWTPAPDNNNPHPSASPLTDTFQFSSVKVSSVPPSSSMKNAVPGLPASSAGLQSVFIATSPVLDTNNLMASNAQHSSDPKPKKRKKAMVSEDLGQKAVHLQSQLVPTPVVSSHISTVATATPVGSVPISVLPVTPLSLADHLKSDWNVEKRILSDESLMKIKEARVNAEEASALSAAAVNHSLEIWKQLDKQKNSGLVSDIEAKLASAAVAVAAAAAVAKAAAAAANVASNAALHAKLMADEALVSSGYDKSCQISHSGVVSNLGKATPASILRGTIGTNSSSSIIGAAKEASRRRMEAASAARKRAENMDAILKAAELAAEAVSQAGKIVTMGDPLELNDLVEAGPGGCWNVAQESSQQVGLLKDVTSGLVNVDNVGDRLESSHICNRDNSSHEKGKKTAASEKLPFHTMHSEIPQDLMRSIDAISPIINTSEKSSKGPKGRRVSDLVNPIDVLPESETEIKAAFTAGNGPENVEGNNFKEGSLVEVFKDGEGFKAAWYTANIISLKDGKAYVCYTVLVDDEGTGPLKEWVSLDGQDDKPPRIRTARTLTGLHNEGTKKRRRAALVDYTWSVGDRVDAWIQESWQEGVLTDKNKKDKTLTVHFPVSGETSVVRDWHLRPSLVWKDGKWIESPKVGAIESFTHEGDTPREKRPKLGNPAVEVKGKDKIPKGSDVVETANPGELRLLDLSENDKVFNIGKNSKNENKSDAQRMARTGLQKEGSRVIFGVPKPAKKRKFMEVSKHYVEDGTSKIKDGNDSVKLANFLIPHGTGSRGWKISSKNETKEKLGADSRPSFKSGKPQSVLGRVIPPKENPLSNSRTNDLTSRAERIKDSSSHFRSEHQVERASYSGNTGAGGGPILYSSVASSTDSHPTKKTSTSRASKGKLAPAGGGLGKIDEEKAFNENPVKSTSEITEPRRSNRRIQPTSRLLEGLQSSLIISKIPSASHEKGHKSQNRNTTRGNNQG